MTLADVAADAMTTTFDLRAVILCRKFAQGGLSSRDWRRVKRADARIRRFFRPDLERQERWAKLLLADMQRAERRVRRLLAAQVAKEAT